jgi:hypothetical protein
VCTANCGSWTENLNIHVTKTHKYLSNFLAFERKIFRRIYGAKYENGEWKSRAN